MEIILQTTEKTALKLPLVGVIFICVAWAFATPAISGENTSLSAEALCAEFFFSPGCRMCAEAKAAVAEAEKAFAGRITLRRFDMSDPVKGSLYARRLFEKLDRYGVKETPVLAVFIGGTCLSGGQAIVAKVHNTFKRELTRPSQKVGHGCIQMAEKTDRIGFWAVTLAALADGVNPCAFATIVLLISMMAGAGKTRRQMILIGSGFSLAVFVTYFVIGLFLYSLFQRLSGYFLISDLIYYAAFSLCLVCGVLSLVDALRIMNGGAAEKMLLRVPHFLKVRMTRYLRRGVHASSSLLLGAFVAGVVVSLFESACTGQVYFPVISGLVRDEATRSRGLVLLLWYNLLFVLPLLVVLTASVLGLSSQRLAKMGRANVPITKLLLASVFVLMALWMLPGLSWQPGVR